MGYTTKFNGRFDMGRIPPGEVIAALRDLEDRDFRQRPLEVKAPSNYCQWVMTKDCKGIEWDRNEKFYNYGEWLDYIVTFILKPAGITLNGRVQFQGEERSDRGWLVVENNEVRVEKQNLVGDTLDELREFRDFVLERQDECDDVIAAWTRRR